MGDILLPGDRLERFGFTPSFLWEYVSAQETGVSMDQDSFFKKAQEWAKGEDAVLWALLEAHLPDQYQWGLISEAEFRKGEQRLRDALLFR